MKAVGGTKQYHVLRRWIFTGQHKLQWTFSLSEGIICRLPPPLAQLGGIGNSKSTAFAR